MKKRIAITLALAMALALAACSNEDNNASESTNAQPGATLGTVMPSGNATTVIDYAPDEAEQNDSDPFGKSLADEYMQTLLDIAIPPYELFNFAIDMDGDGVDDAVNVYANKLNAHSHQVSAEFIINGVTYNWKQNDESFSHDTSAFTIKTLDGKNCLILGMEMGGTGGGATDYCALAFDDGIYELALPKMEPYGSHGVNAVASYIDGYRVEIRSSETGAVLGILDMPADIQEAARERKVYLDNGKTNGGHFADVGYVSSSGVSRIMYGGMWCVEIKQHISAGILGTADTLGYLVSDLTWDESGYVILAQSVIDQTVTESPEPAYYPDLDDLEYSDLAGMEFWFGSGVGAWSTIVTMEPDGKFNGYYHDSDMGDDGAGFPNGTRYECYFSGKFSQLTKVGDYEYSMRVESLFTEGVLAEERIIDGTKIITSEPYGFDNADVFYLYLPGKEADGLSDEFLWWVRDKVRPDGVLMSYCLYNAGGQQGYVVW